MKKLTLILIVVFASCSILTYAQTEEGKFLLMGNSSLIFDFGKNKTKSDGTTSDNYKYFDLSFIPMAGRTIIDNLVVGGYIDASMSKTSQKDSDNFSRSGSLAIGPFGRYYVYDLNGLKPMVELATGIGTYCSKSDYGYGEYKDNAFLWEFWLGAGATYFVTENIGIDGMVGYYRDALKYKGDDSGSRSEGSYTDICGEIFFYFGVVVVL